MAVQAPPGRAAVERVEEVLARNAPELVEDLLRAREFDGQRVQPGLPRTGGAVPEVRRHVLDDERSDQIRPVGGQAPRMQPTHRVSDQDDRPAERCHSVAEVADETFGLDRVRMRDVAATVPGAS